MTLSIWVDNNIAYFRIHLDMTLKGSVELSMINGRVSVEENGRIRFLDREFNITQGEIKFNNPERLDPTINLSTESEVSSSAGSSEYNETYLVKLNILSPLDDLDFNLSSEPALDGADIMSLLSLGVTYQQLQASGDANTLLTNRAEVLTTLELSNQLNNYFDKWLGDYIDIDRIGIGGNVFDPSQVRFEVTKKWSDNVELSYSTAIDKLDKQILKAKIKLIKYLYLEGKTDQENESGADLLFRIKFK
ncbi:MAG: translocation/assembly module TamB domain-containing protein [Ignavibacteriaceae bacterium]